MAKWLWRSRSMTPIFNTSPENHRMHIWCGFGDCSSNPLHVIAQTNRISYNSQSKWSKWPWRSVSITLFSIPAESIPGCMHNWWFQLKSVMSYQSMMTSSNGNIFRVTGTLCGEFTGDRWIPLTKASDAELWCFLWSAPWINGWVKNREAGDLRRNRAHDDVIAMQVYRRTDTVAWYRYTTPVLLCGHRRSSLLNMGRERRWPRWIKKALHIGIKRLCGQTDGGTDGQTDRRRKRQYPFGQGANKGWHLKLKI